MFDKTFSVSANKTGTSMKPLDVFKGTWGKFSNFFRHETAENLWGDIRTIYLLFFTVTKWFLCLNQTGPWAQRHNRELNVKTHKVLSRQHFNQLIGQKVNSVFSSSDSVTGSAGVILLISSHRNINTNCSCVSAAQHLSLFPLQSCLVKLPVYHYQNPVEKLPEQRQHHDNTLHKSDGNKNLNVSGGIFPPGRNRSWRDGWMERCAGMWETGKLDLFSNLNKCTSVCFYE